MGLWGSKQPRTLTVQNNEPPGEVYVTENALNNVLKSKETTPTTESKEEPVSSNETNNKSELNLKLSPDWHDKRIEEYERNMLKNFEKSTKEVERLFNSRYRTVPVCSELQKEVSECYKQNQNLPLNCLDIANRYIKCVEEERKSRIDLSYNLKRDQESNRG